MKHLKLLLFFICISLGASFAQESVPTPIADDWHDKKWQFLTSKAQLSQEDAAKVYPVFLAYEKAVWDLHRKNRESFKNAMKDKTQKPNYEELNDAYVDFEFRQAQMLKNYHYQLKKILDSETLFRYYRAEREFKRKLLMDFQEKRSSEKPRN